MKNFIYITYCLLIFVSCNRNNCIKNNCFHIRKWIVYNPNGDSYSITTDTFNTKFIKEIGTTKVVFDSLLKANSNKLDQIITFSDKNITIEAKKEIPDQNKTVKVFRISSYTLVSH